MMKVDKYKIAIFFDEDSTRNLLVKMAQKRGFEVSAFNYPVNCDAIGDFNCKCTKTERCADIMILGRHFSVLRALDILEHQSEIGCKLPIANKLMISSTYDEKDEARGKALGIKILYMPIAFKELNSWFDECEERLKPKK